MLCALWGSARQWGGRCPVVGGDHGVRSLIRTPLRLFPGQLSLLSCLPLTNHPSQVCFIGEAPVPSPTPKTPTTITTLGKSYPTAHKSKINNTCAQHLGSSILRILKINLAYYILARHHCRSAHLLRAHYYGRRIL